MLLVEHGKRCERCAKNGKPRKESHGPCPLKKSALAAVKEDSDSSTKGREDAVKAEDSAAAEEDGSTAIKQEEDDEAVNVTAEDAAVEVAVKQEKGDVKQEEDAGDVSDDEAAEKPKKAKRRRKA